MSEATDAPAFLDGEVGEAGRSLSAGQRQLLCLARALFRREQSRYSVVCLDEATASLDDICEKKIRVWFNVRIACYFNLYTAALLQREVMITKYLFNAID